MILESMLVKWCTPIYFWWKYKLVKPLCKTGRQFFKLLNIHISCDPVISLLSIYPREKKTYDHIKILSSMFIAAFFIITQK